MIKVGSYEFDSPLNLEGSWGSRQIAEKAHSVMTLYKDDEIKVRTFYSGFTDYMLVEWEAGEDDFESIGLYLKGGVVIDIDGVMSNPPQLFELLDKFGIKYDAELKDED